MAGEDRFNVCEDRGDDPGADCDWVSVRRGAHGRSFGGNVS